MVLRTTLQLVLLRRLNQGTFNKNGTDKKLVNVLRMGTLKTEKKIGR
jgi:transcriptional regulator of aromatic amino acid metabolism